MTLNEIVVLYQVLEHKEINPAFTTLTYKIARGLERQGLLREGARLLSPYHTTFKLTREGRRIAKAK
ncbi:hypothetical protein LCGC14_1981620 [marine sediment metagenome]|uniref:Uncharacterized protein n=1 Tax=marine sediment metagenome TaxID=412755 RepID=A0A0F9F8R1_9ZZZZ